MIASEIEMLEEEIAVGAEGVRVKQKLEELEAVNNERTARIEQLEAAIAETAAATRQKPDGGVEGADRPDRRAAEALRQRITSLQSQLQHGHGVGRQSRTGRQ